MKKPTANKLSFNAQTIRTLNSDQLAHVAGGTISVQSSGTTIINPSGGITSLNTSLYTSLNPSGGR